MGIRGLLISSAVTYVGTILSVLLIMGYYGVALREAGTEAYGTLQSIMSFTFLLYAGRSVIGSYVVIHTGGDERQLPSVVRQAVILITYISLGMAALFVLTAPLLRDFLKLESSLPLLFISISAIPVVLTGGVEGILNVQKKFLALSLSSMIIPLCSLIGAYVLLQNGFQESDAGWIIFLSSTMGLVHACLWVDRGFLGHLPKKSYTSLKLLGELMALLASSVAFGLALRIDLFWAKHALDSAGAGTYAIATSIGMVLFLISSGVARVTSVSFRSEPALTIITASYGIIVLTCLTLGLGFAIAGDATLLLLSGRHINIDWSVLLPLFFSFTLYSIVTLDFTCLNVVTKHVHVGISIALACVQIVALKLFGTSATAIAQTQCAVMAAFTVMFTLWLFRAVRGSGKAVPAHPAEHHLAPTA